MNRVTRLYRELKLWLIMKRGRPRQFYFVGEDTGGRAVGPELAVTHLTFHDMAAWACRCRLTEDVVLKKLPANAIRIVSFKRLDETTGRTTFQPCWIDKK